MLGDEPISVSCRAVDDGWECRVTVGELGRQSEHEVSVARAELERFWPGQADPTALVEESFRFLLERESKESILGRFAVSDIGRYFPEYPTEIRSRLA